MKYLVLLTDKLCTKHTFTQDKGFVVESRRGLGGFIRIGRVPLQDLIYQDI